MPPGSGTGMPRGTGAVAARCRLLGSLAIPTHEVGGTAVVAVARTSRPGVAAGDRGGGPLPAGSGRGFAVWELPARPREVAGLPFGVLLQVELVLRLGLPERPSGRDLRDDPAGPQTGRVHVGDRVVGDPPLLISCVEDRRTVLGADFVHLAVQRRRIMDLEEELKDVAERGLLRVEDDLDGLGVGPGVGLGGVGGVPA